MMAVAFILGIAVGIVATLSRHVHDWESTSTAVSPPHVVKRACDLYESPEKTQAYIDFATGTTTYVWQCFKCGSHKTIRVRGCPSSK